MASFSLRPTVAPWSRPLPAWICVALAAGSLALAWPALATIPGLHADEASAGLKAAQLLEGVLPGWFGTKPHTGPLHVLLVALSFAALGPSPMALRLVGVLANAVAVGLYAWVSGQLFGRRTALLATALLATAPFFWANARTATEHAALAAPLALAAVACLLRARRPSRLKADDDPTVTARPGDHQARRRWALAAGVCLGLGTWNHVIFLALPLTLLTLATFRLGSQMWRRPEVGWTLFGWACVAVGPLTQVGRRLQAAAAADDSTLGGRVAGLPALMAQVWQGDVVALRLTGVVGAPAGPWPLALLSITGVGLLAAAFDLGGGAKRARLVLSTTACLTVWTAVVLPAHGEHHLLLPLLALPWAVCLGATTLASVTGPRGGALATVACMAVACAQLSHSLLNVVLPLQAHDVVARAYTFGAQAQTSNHSRDVRGLYQALCAREVGAIHAQPFIAAPLRFYDLGHDRLQVHELPAAPQQAAASLAAASPAASGPVAVVTYADEWPALAAPLAEARVSLPPQVATLGPFRLVQLPPPF